MFSDVKETGMTLRTERRDAPRAGRDAERLLRWAGTRVEPFTLKEAAFSLELSETRVRSAVFDLMGRGEILAESVTAPVRYSAR